MSTVLLSFLPICTKKPSTETALDEKTPPLVWGKLEKKQYLYISLQEHPHMCGENLKRVMPFWYFKGSPPLMWGKPKSRPCLAIFGWITPTCVGKTKMLYNRTTSNKDHPHMCGESVSLLVVDVLIPGSPPHVWGKLFLALECCFFVGITPTCVGKTDQIARSLRVGQDHPHLCRENPGRKSYSKNLIGSPPLA